jgi:hypothetical protein
MHFGKLAFLTVLSFSAILGAFAAPVSAQNFGSPRQYYAPWQKHPSHNYFFRQYYFKPTPTFSGYRHHYAIFHPSRPQHIYFYNPHKKVFWGRCPAQRDGEATYSLLAEKDRKGALKDIAESAFPKPAATPPIPDSRDGAVLDLPPDDLPEGAQGVSAALPAE